MKKAPYRFCNMAERGSRKDPQCNMGKNPRCLKIEMIRANTKYVSVNVQFLRCGLMEEKSVKRPFSAHLKTFFGNVA